MTSANTTTAVLLTDGPDAGLWALESITTFTDAKGRKRASTFYPGIRFATETDAAAYLTRRAA